MLQVALARLFRLGIILGVVVAIGKSQASLIDAGDLLLGVIRILNRGRSEHRCPRSLELQPCDERG